MARTPRRTEEDTREAPAEEATVASLLAKGGGVLRRVGNVYTYPGCPIDPSGTNLRLPRESVSEEQVREAIEAGELRTSATGRGDVPTTLVEATEQNAELRPIPPHLAGTVYAGTELPPDMKPPEPPPEDGDGLDKPPPGTDPPLGGSGEEGSALARAHARGEQEVARQPGKDRVS